jgi:hypothetical protein
LEVTCGSRRELALVDVSTTSARHVGSRALWHPDGLDMLFCAFAEPDGIGLSSVAGLLCPTPRDDPRGVVVTLAPAATAPYVVHAPIAPGLVVPVGVLDWRPFVPGESIPVTTSAGVIAVDGEREIELAPGAVATVTMRADGPRCVDVPAVMRAAAHQGLMQGVDLASASGRPRASPAVHSC